MQGILTLKLVLSMRRMAIVLRGEVRNISIEMLRFKLWDPYFCIYSQNMGNFVKYKVFNHPN